MSNPASAIEARALLDILAESLRSKDVDRRQLEETLEKLKILGRIADNVSAIYNEDGVSILGSYAFGDYPSSIRQEATRCIANAVLLLPSTRQYSLQLGLDKKAVDALRDATFDQEFLFSRILFLLTLDPKIDLEVLITDHDLAGIIVKLLSRHADQAKQCRPEGQMDQAGLALQETLKLLFSATNAKTEQTAQFSPAVVELFAILNHTDIPSPPLQPPMGLLINALANLEVDGEKIGNKEECRSATDKLVTILEESVTEYLPTELDTNAIPLLTALRCINEVAGPDLREAMKVRLLPDDKERDLPLGRSSSLASKLLRLTTSSGTLKLAEVISGLMFELSDKDANQYVKNVGYGNAAGYLVSHNIPVPESAKRSQTGGQSSDEAPINPITGQRLDREVMDDLPPMTQEEKEREAERLFVLFERLKATGVVDVKNPVEQARDEGRFEELSDSGPD